MGLPKLKWTAQDRAGGERQSVTQFKVNGT